MSAGAIALVTTAIKQRLDQALSLADPGGASNAKTYVGPLDDADAATAHLVLFLYRITPNQSMRNAEHRVSFMASWPAPLGRRSTGRPSASTAFSQRCCQTGSLGAADALMASSLLQRRPRRAVIACSSASMSATRASRWASVGARMSRLKQQRPGTTLIEPLGTCH